MLSEKKLWTILHVCKLANCLGQVFPRRFRDRIWIPRIENWIPRIIKNRVPRIREIGPYWSILGTKHFPLKNPALGD